MNVPLFNSYASVILRTSMLRHWMVLELTSLLAEVTSVTSLTWLTPGISARSWSCESYAVYKRRPRSCTEIWRSRIHCSINNVRTIQLYNCRLLAKKPFKVSNEGVATPDIFAWVIWQTQCCSCLFVHGRTVVYRSHYKPPQFPPKIDFGGLNYSLQRLMLRLMLTGPAGLYWGLDRPNRTPSCCVAWQLQHWADPWTRVTYLLILNTRKQLTIYSYRLRLVILFRSLLYY